MGGCDKEEAVNSRLALWWKAEAVKQCRRVVLESELWSSQGTQDSGVSTNFRARPTQLCILTRAPISQVSYSGKLLHL